MCLLWGLFFLFLFLTFTISKDWLRPPFVSPKSKRNKMPWVKIKSLWHTARSLLCLLARSHPKAVQIPFQKQHVFMGNFSFFLFFFSLFRPFDNLQLEGCRVGHFLICRFNNHDGLNKYLLSAALTWIYYCAWGSSKLKPPQMARCLEHRRGGC